MQVGRIVCLTVLALFADIGLRMDSICKDAIMYVDAIPFLSAQFRKFPTAASDTLGLPDSGCSCRQWVSRRLEAGQIRRRVSVWRGFWQQVAVEVHAPGLGCPVFQIGRSWGILISSCEAITISSDGMMGWSVLNLQAFQILSREYFQSPSSLCQLRIFWSLRCRANMSLQALQTCLRFTCRGVLSQGKGSGCDDWQPDWGWAGILSPLCLSCLWSCTFLYLSNVKCIYFWKSSFILVKVRHGCTTSGSAW